MSDYLVHYGVKGMKWGVRKQRRLQNKIGRSAQKAANHAGKALKYKSGPKYEKEWKKAASAQKKGEIYMKQYEDSFATTVYGHTDVTENGRVYILLRYGKGENAKKKIYFSNN